MVNEAKAHAEDDKKAKEAIEIKNRADSMVYQTEKQLAEHGDKLPAEVKQPVVDGIEKLKKAIADNNTELMQSTMTEIEQHLMKFGEQIYQQAQQAQQAGAADASANNANDTKKNDDGVVDAEIVD